MVNLLFDYDGTLHDSLAIYAPAVQAAYDTLVAKGYAAPKTWPRETIRQWIGLTPQEMWDRFQPNLPREEQLARSTQVGEEMLALIGQGRAQLYPGPAPGAGPAEGDGAAPAPAEQLPRRLPPGPQGLLWAGALV